MDRRADLQSNPEFSQKFSMLSLKETTAEGWFVMPQGTQWTWHWGRVDWVLCVFQVVLEDGTHTGELRKEWRPFVTPACMPMNHSIRWHGNFPTPDRPFPHEIGWTCPQCLRMSPSRKFQSVLKTPEALQEPAA